MYNKMMLLFLPNLTLEFSTMKVVEVWHNLNVFSAADKTIKNGTWNKLLY